MKDKNFYYLSKKMFDRLNPQIAHNPKIDNDDDDDDTQVYKKPWVGLTEWEREAIAHACGAMSADWLVFIEATEKALKEKNT